MNERHERKSNAGLAPALVAILVGLTTVISSLWGTFFASSHIPNLPTTTSTAAIALSPFKTFIPLTSTLTPTLLPTATSTQTPMPPDPDTGVIEINYIVLVGDSFPKISEKLLGSDTYATAIRRANCVSTLPVQYELTIKYYTVQDNEALRQIADRLGINAGLIAYINSLDDFSVHLGQLLILPLDNKCY